MERALAAISAECRIRAKERNVRRTPGPARRIAMRTEMMFERRECAKRFYIG